MTDDELELRILQRFVARFDEGEIADPDRTNKCARELDMRDVLRDLTGSTGPALDSEARRWLMQLAPRRPGSDRGPLRLCSNNRDRESAHQFHARAFLDPNATATSGWNRIRALKKELGLREPESKIAVSSTIRLFISHASDDKELARRVVALFRAALNLPASAIRCTSVDGHRLEGGADTDDTVLSEIGSADAFVGILSDRSMRSKYVLIELGARWGLKKHLLPLLAPETSASVLGGPLAGKNALQADSEAQLHQMVREVGRVLGINPESPDVYLRQLQDVRDWRPTVGSDQHLEIQMPAADPEKAKWSEGIRIAADLNSAATQLLKAAAADPKATIIRSRTHNTGTSIRTTDGSNLVEVGNARSEAEWEGALKQLEEKGLVFARGGKREIFALTGEGFRIADLIVIAPDT
jgi:TIR domain